MSRDKQIEEMAEAILDNCQCGSFESEAYGIAEFVIAEKGYRKSTDVAEEIFELIDCAFSPVLVYNGYTVKEYLAELKKKYTEEK